MSGGHWNYQQYKIEEYSERVSLIVDTIAQIEHELDWGYSSDTCAGCAEARTLLALHCLFDRLSGEWDSFEGMSPADVAKKGEAWCSDRHKEWSQGKTERPSYWGSESRYVGKLPVT